MRKTIAFMTAAVLALPVGSALADQGMQGTKDKSATQQGAPIGAAGLMSSDDIVGSQVRDANGENLGNVNDLMVRSDGKIDAAIVSLGGVFGVGDRKVKVPWSSLKVQREANDPDDLFVTASRQTLEGAPAFDDDAGTTASRGTTADDDDPRSARTTGDAPMNPAR
jgi:hypothetical protein